MPDNGKFHLFTDDAMGTRDAVALATAIQRREVSPREVITAAVSRARAAEPALRAIATEDYERALERSESAPDGFFSGVPVLIKDNTPVTGLPTGFGSAAIESAPARHDAPFARQLLAQGFINLGKSTLPEFGFSASTEFAHRPPTCNPWHQDYSSGASSGGSAALVAAGAVPLAHANDGGGSIRIPAACCGLVGLKSTRGRLIDNEAARSLPVNIISEGVLTRTVRDTAAFFAHAERYYRSRRLPAIGDVRGPGNKRLRIGLITDSINGQITDPETRAATEQAARSLQGLGHQVEPLATPVDNRFPEDFARYWAMLAFMVRTAGKRAIDRSFNKHQVDNLTRGLDRKCRRELHRLPGTLWRLKRSGHHYTEALGNYDAVITPVLGHTTPKLGYLSPIQPFESLFDRLQAYACFTPLANATGAPAISLPLGQTGQGLPIGVQLMAHLGQERLLLELAYELEEAVGWKRIDECP